MLQRFHIINDNVNTFNAFELAFAIQTSHLTFLDADVKSSTK
jgi:hypothetical protein